jgi:hypothetical protein
MIDKWLKAGVLEDGLLHPATEGWGELKPSPPLGRVNRQRDEPDVQRMAAAFMR